MNHHNSVRKFGRPASQRKALLNSLARALVLAGKIETSEAKAKELRSFVEKIVTKGKLGTLSATRDIAIMIGDDAEKIVRTTLAPKYKDRKGGYTRVVKLAQVRSDASKQAIIEFV